jgi:glutamate synthase (NADPH/NADH) small chain
VRARHQRAAGDHQDIENAIVDKGWEQGWIVPEPPSARTGKKVAVIGSGPAGLAAAAQLNRAGHTVTVLERDDRPGGLLMYGIPNMKLDKRDVVMRRIELHGKGRHQVHLQRQRRRERRGDAAAERFRRHGHLHRRDPAARPQRGRRALQGVHFAMEYLTASTKAILNGGPEHSPIHARDRHVIVIGGGDTGTDCVGTAMRQGCKSLTQIEILPRPPMDRAQDNPWPEWPKVYKLDYAQEEAAAKFGADPRVYVSTVKSLNGDAAGRVQSLTTVQICWQQDASGRFVPPKCRAARRRFQPTWCCWRWDSPALSSRCSRTWYSNRCTLECAGRTRPVYDQRPRTVHRGRLSTRAKPDRMGHQ